MTLRQEYIKLRRNIVKRVERIKKAGLQDFSPEFDLEKARNLTDEEIIKELARARMFNKQISYKKSVQRKQARGEEEKLFAQGRKKDAYFLRGVRKWLDRQGFNVNLINEKNVKDWQDYINYRTSVTGEKKKYEFDKYIEDMADVLTEDEETEDVLDVFEDFKEYMSDQQKLIEEAKNAFDSKEMPEEYKNYYSSKAIADRFFSGKA